MERKARSERKADEMHLIVTIKRHTVHMLLMSLCAHYHCRRRRWLAAMTIMVANLYYEAVTVAYSITVLSMCCAWLCVRVVHGDMRGIERINT